MAMAGSVPTSTDSLIFPSASHNFSSTLSSLKRSTLSTTNRLHSIHHDSILVQEIALKYGLPLIANERCGSWYIPPEKKAGSTYFKSTDGHWGQWNFSTRRLNWQVLDIIGRSGGCIIVDSTRRGKSMPDALSKTIPVWCTVINRLLFKDVAEAHTLYAPREVVGASEHAQMEARINGFVATARSLNLDINTLHSTLKRPLRTSWITPDSISSNSPQPSPKYLNVICCTASRRVVGAEMTGNGYIQGAGDDSEGWSYGLTPSLFWDHKDQLLAAAEQDLPGIISKMLSTQSISRKYAHEAVQIGSTNIYIGNLADSAQSDFYDGIITCGKKAPCQDPSKLRDEERAKALHFCCGAGKIGSRALRSQLSRLPAFIDSLLVSNASPAILCTCPTGRDLSVGLALSILCLYFNDDYRFAKAARCEKIDKPLIRRRLAYIMTVHQGASPSRSTLQSVNSFLMPENG